MASFSLKPQRSSSSRIYHTICSTTASEWRSLRQSRSSVSWSWKKHTRLRLRCCQGSDEGDDSRLSQNTGIFHPSIWGDFFLGCSSSPDEAAASSQQKAWMERCNELKEEVGRLMVVEANSPLHERLHFIDALESLCLDHLLEEEIGAALTQIETADVSDDCDIGTVSLWFYLLRKHRHRASPDVFVRFRDAEGGFQSNDPGDLLRLYNAAHFRTHGETILDEAIAFARSRLEMMLPYVQAPLLAHEVRSSLEIPLPRRVRIYESKYYIHAYETSGTLHEKVLQLAKLSSNVLQLHHQQELKILTRWWEDMKIGSKLPFARDRIVECFLWILGVYYEPCHSRARITLTMVIAIVTLLDDIFDSFATPQECEILTNCIESWDPKGAQDLPGCMKFALEKILDSYQTITNMLHREDKCRMTYLRHFTKDLVRGFNMEVKMLQKGYIPESVEEHLKVSLRTGGCPILSCACFVGMDDIATKDFFDWISSLPKMVRALSIILRLADDLHSYEREQLIPHVASTIDTYMKKHNVSIEVAQENIHKLKEESWKDLNSEWLNPCNDVYPKQLLERIFNLARTMEFMYNQEDNFTNCHNLKDTIRCLLVEPYTIHI